MLRKCDQFDCVKLDLVIRFVNALNGFKLLKNNEARTEIGKRTKCLVVEILRKCTNIQRPIIGQ